MPDNDFRAVFGDLHNHCNISYGHGTLDDALHNAALRLDFVSITGHADWPDMPVNDPRVAHIVAFHVAGFEKLRTGWDDYLRRIAEFESQHGLVTFPGYEVHSNRHGDYTIVGLDHNFPMILEESPQALRRAFAERTTGGPPPALLFPHHIGYRPGARGVNWDSFDGQFSPVVEIYSMHGLADSDHSDKPSLHSMGPWQHYGTMEHGLSLGNRFGVIGNTDHHSGHPGSYGHGLTGAWSRNSSRSAIWDALHNRRTWAMTGDMVRLWTTVGGTPMGGELPPGAGPGSDLPFEIEADSTSAIDYVELIGNGRRMFLAWENPQRGAGAGTTAGATAGDREAILSLELGWGERGKMVDWDVTVELTNTEILECIPRFRGAEIVSPLDKTGNEAAPGSSTWDRSGNTVRFRTSTWGNMTNSTPSTQGFAMRIASPGTANLSVTMNGRVEQHRVSDLLKGSVSGNLGPIDSPAFRLSAEPESAYRWSVSGTVRAAPGWYSTRVRLRNGHWAVASPVFVAD